MTSPYKWIEQSSSPPASPSAGKGWLDIDNGSLWVRMGDDWIPIVSVARAVAAAPLYNGIQYFVNFKNQTAICRRANAKDRLTSRVDMASFILQDSDGTEKPANSQDVTIFRGDTFEKIFGGIILAAPQRKMGYRKYRYIVRCADYSRLLNKKLIVETYEGKTGGFIIKHIVDNYFDAGEFDYDDVQNGPIIDKIVFNYKPAGNCLKEVARLTGYDWYVDYDRGLHYFSYETNSAPYELTEDATSGRFKGLSIDIDSSQLINKVTVQGGYFLSNLYTQERVADGTQVSFELDYAAQGDIKAYVDAGGGYVEKTVGIDNIDSSGFDFVVNVTEKTIKNLDLAKLNNGDLLKVTYKYKVPILATVEDYENQQAVAAIEGGGGIHEKIIIDDEIATLEAARDRAYAELRQYGNAIVKGSFRTDQDGYRSGQLLTVNLPTRDIDSQYLIQTVSKKSLRKGLMEYTVTFATMLTGLTDFLLSLWDESKRVIVRGDEVPDELMRKPEEIVFTPTVPTTEEFTPPFQFGPGGSPQGKFNESQFA